MIVGSISSMQNEPMTDSNSRFLAFVALSLWKSQLKLAIILVIKSDYFQLSFDS